MVANSQLSSTQIDNPANHSVLIGMSDSIDSFVAAYLLKKQGFNLKALVCVSWAKNTVGIKSKVEDEEIFTEITAPRCYIENISAIEKFCEAHSIPLFLTDAVEEFKDKILDSAVSAKICGKTYQTCFRCTKFRMQILHEKAKLIKCDFIATAHYAKVYKNHSTNEFFIYRSNDHEFDQSYKLSSVPKNLLDNLILPLSDLKKDDVLKIAKQLELVMEDKKLSDKKKLCFVHDPKFKDYVNAVVPKSLHFKGKIEEYKTKNILGDHEGLHHYFEGQSGLVLSDSAGKERYHVIDIQESDKKISLHQTDLKFSTFHLYDCEFAEELDRSKHIDLFIKIGFSDDIIPCQVVFKNSRNCIIYLEEERAAILGNSLCVLYSSNKTTSRVLGNGFIGVRGNITPVDRTKDYKGDIENDSADNIKAFGF